MTTYSDLTTLLKSKVKTDSGITSYVVDMTPDGATRALGENFHNNRKLRQANVSRFAAAISGGYFVAGSPIRFTYDNDKLTLVDGQHRLSAIVQSGCTVPVTVIVSSNDAAKEYALVDTIQQTRSSADALIALDEDAKEFGYTALTVYVSAVNVIARNFSPRFDPVSRLITAKFFGEFKPQIAQCDEAFGAVGIMQGTTSRGVFKSPPLAVALATAKHIERSKWEEFWVKVKTDDGLRLGDPRKRLHVYLSQPSNAGKTGQAQLLNATVKLWNAYMEGRELQKLYLDGEMERIVGTPYPMQ